MKQPIAFWGLRGFLILWAGQSVSTLGSALTSYALILWIYTQRGTATSVAMLSFFTYLPSILLCFAAGALTDRWDKKRVMLCADFVAALGTASVLALHLTGRLEIWHLYLVNFVISCMNAFQNPASYVFEPFMLGNSCFAAWLSPVLGAGPGSGMALMFLIVGIVGSTVSFRSRRDKEYWTLD